MSNLSSLFFVSKKKKSIGKKKSAGKKKPAAKKPAKKPVYHSPKKVKPVPVVHADDVKDFPSISEDDLKMCREDAARSLQRIQALESELSSLKDQSEKCFSESSSLRSRAEKCDTDLLGCNTDLSKCNTSFSKMRESLRKKAGKQAKRSEDVEYDTGDITNRTFLYKDEWEKAKGARDAKKAQKKMYKQLSETPLLSDSDLLSTDPNDKKALKALSKKIAQDIRKSSPTNKKIGPLNKNIKLDIPTKKTEEKEDFPDWVPDWDAVVGFGKGKKGKKRSGKKSKKSKKSLKKKKSVRRRY